MPKRKVDPIRRVFSRRPSYIATCQDMDSTSRRSSESAEIRANKLLQRRERERARRASETAKNKRGQNGLLRLRKKERQPCNREGRDNWDWRAERGQTSEDAGHSYGCRDWRTKRGQAAEDAHHDERITTETDEQREAKVQRMHINHNEKITTETEEQRPCCRGLLWELRSWKNGPGGPKIPHTKYTDKRAKCILHWSRIESKKFTRL